MAFARPFAYNPGTPIPGTEQVGSLSIGAPTSGFTNNPQYWNGPDEELGYVIAQSVSGNTQPTEIPGVFASVGFFRTNTFDDNEFVQLANTVSNSNYTTASEASLGLTANGYWNSFIPVTPTPTETTAPTPTPTPTETSSPTPTPTVTPTSTDLTNITTYTISGCSSLNVFVANLGPGALAPGDVFYFEFTGGTPSGCYRIVNKINAVPTDGTTPLYFYTSCALCVAAREVTPTPTVTQTPTPTETPTPTGTPSSTSTPTPTPTSGGGWFFFFANGATVTRAPNNNGETVFYDGLGNSVYNPNYTSGILRLSFNNINTAGTSYASQFSTLNNSGGTITISQGSSTVIYSGTSTDYVGNASLIRLDVTSSAQMIQSASTQFVSGTSINVVVS